MDRMKLSRRHLLKWTGAASAVVAVSGAWLPNFGISAALAADLGEGDVGVLNYAYALEQLEAAFYTQVIDTPYSGITEDETSWLTDIRDHEIAHRDFLKDALADGAIPDLEVDFSTVDFTSRDSVLNTAKTFEDLGGRRLQRRRQADREPRLPAGRRQDRFDRGTARRSYPRHAEHGQRFVRRRRRRRRERSRCCAGAGRGAGGSRPVHQDRSHRQSVHVRR
jgi:hypothetical protein